MNCKHNLGGEGVHVPPATHMKKLGDIFVLFTQDSTLSY